MDSDSRATVVLGWHLHQPCYLLPDGGPFELPWCYLHGIGGYSDLARRLEENPEARVVINFSPVLIEQLRTYSRRLHSWLAYCDLSEEPTGDPILDSLVLAPAPEPGEAAEVMRLRFLLEHMPAWILEALPQAATGTTLAREILDEPARWCYLSAQLTTDLSVWFHLGWTGESLHQDHELIHQLMSRGADYQFHHQLAFFRLIADILDGLLTRYRRLARQGRIELCTSPWGHPILPLLLDPRCAIEAQPELELPEAPYPGGHSRAQWHLREAITCFRQTFGLKPCGLWPSEAAISSDLLPMVAERGFQWFASSARVLDQDPDRPLEVHNLFQFEQGRLMGFFRDDHLSDLIGFTYQGWETSDAVAHLVEQLDTVAAQHEGDSPCVITIFLDGENPWPTYPDRGWHFTRELYHALTTHPRLRMALFRELLELPGAGDGPAIHAGSWVGGNLATWIGYDDKNQAWRLLSEAARRVGAVLAKGTLPQERVRAIEKQLGVCEGSDWFWWMGEGQAAIAVEPFERLFRQQLMALYRMAGLTPPDTLFQSISQGAEQSVGVHTMLGGNG